MIFSYHTALIVFTSAYSLLATDRIFSDLIKLFNLAKFAVSSYPSYKLLIHIIYPLLIGFTRCKFAEIIHSPLIIEFSTCDSNTISVVAVLFIMVLIFPVRNRQILH